MGLEKYQFFLASLMWQKSIIHPLSRIWIMGKLFGLHFHFTSSYKNQLTHADAWSYEKKNQSAINSNPVFPLCFHINLKSDRLPL